MKKWILVVALLLASGPAFCQSPDSPGADTAVIYRGGDAPPHRGDLLVVDKAQILTEATRWQLEGRLRDYAARTRIELAVVTVASLHGQDVAVVGDSIKNALGVGNRLSQTGILYLIAPTEQRQSIRVGRGLEAYLTDAECKRILEQTTPRPSQDLAAAIVNRTHAIIHQLERDQAELARDQAQDQAMAAEEIEPAEISAGSSIGLGWLYLAFGVFFCYLARVSTRFINEWTAPADRPDGEPMMTEPPAGRWRNRKRLVRAQFRGAAKRNATRADQAQSTGSSSPDLTTSLVLTSLLSDDDNPPRKNISSSDWFSSGGSGSSSSSSGSNFSYGGDSDTGGGGASSDSW